MREIGHFIGGKAVKGGSGRFGDVFDPNTGEVQAKVALAKHSEVEHAIANAQALGAGHVFVLILRNAYPDKSAECGAEHPRGVFDFLRDRQPGGSDRCKNRTGTRRDGRD